MSGWAWAALWVPVSLLIAVGIGRAIRIADESTDVWGCDECAAEAAVEEALAEARLRHPSARKAREVAELQAILAES